VAPLTPQAYRSDLSFPDLSAIPRSQHHHHGSLAHFAVSFSPFFAILKEKLQHDLILLTFATKQSWMFIKSSG